MTPWTVAYQAPPSMGFSRQEYWSGLPFPSVGDLHNPGIEPRSPALQADSLPAEPQGKPYLGINCRKITLMVTLPQFLNEEVPSTLSLSLHSLSLTVLAFHRFLNGTMTASEPRTCCSFCLECPSHHRPCHVCPASSSLNFHQHYFQGSLL